MHSLFYVSGTGDVRIPMDDPTVILVGTASALRGRKWDYDLGRHSITSVNRSARDESISVFFTDGESADLLRRVADRDVINNTPGILETVGGWTQRAYIVECTPSDITEVHHSAKVSVVLLDGVWRRSHVVMFEPSKDGGGTDLDLPYDLPYDLSAPPATKSVQVGEWSPCAVSITVYGSAINPYITIGKNRYQVDCDVPDGGFLRVDGISKSIVVTDKHGSTENVFGKARRGSGVGSGSYIFERIQPGESDVSWDGSFTFDLEWYEEEGEIPWALSSQIPPTPRSAL